MVSRTLRCNKCGKDKPIRLMKYVVGSKDLICTDCLDPKKEEPVKKQAQQEGQAKRYKCRKCGHLQQIKPNFKKICSYCGSNELIPQEWNSDLDNLIDESSKRQYDF